nr:hypothetical protein CFP56_46500 [Quercus suber]
MVASKRDSLCMQILRDKYKVDHSWLRYDPPKSASPVWKEIDKAKSIVIKGACYTIGDGASIDVYLVLNSLEALCQTWGHWKVSLTMALILDKIWHLKNAKLFMRSNSNLTTSILSIQRSCQEYLTMCHVSLLRLKQQNPTRCSPSPPGYIKLNTDAALSSTRIALAVIARDSMLGFMS